MRICFIVIFSLSAFFSFAQEQRIDSIPKGGLLLNKGWVFHAGDNRQWSESNYDDGQWLSIDPTKDIRDLPELWNNSVVWFRLRLNIDSSLQGKTLALLIEQTGASEIYLNGKLIKAYGVISSANVKAERPPWSEFIEMQLDDSSEQVLAVRFAIQKNIPYIKFAGYPNSCLVVSIMDINGLRNVVQGHDYNSFDFLEIRAGIFFILAILHLALFCFYTVQKANLYFFIYAILWGIESLLENYTNTEVYSASFKTYSAIWVFSFTSLGLLFLLLAIYNIFKYKTRIVFYLLIALFLINHVLLFNYYDNGSLFGLLVFPILIFLESLRVTILALHRKQSGSRIILTGEISYLVCYSSFWMVFLGLIPVNGNSILGDILFHFAAISIPLAISIFLALEASLTNRFLKQKLLEVQSLSEKNVAQEQEKQEILAAQNLMLEKQVTERTSELKHSLDELKSTQTQLIQKEKMATLGELTAGIAHEIQNPLNFVNNFSEVNEELLKELKTEAEKGNLEEVKAIANDIAFNSEKINHHGKRADSIVKGMLQHSRTSSGQREPTDINALCDEYLRLTYHGLRAKEKSFNATTKTEFDNNIGKINVVAQDLGRVILNLINNAFYAVSEKQKLNIAGYEPTVTVSTKKEKNKVEIRVKDNGNGIPQKIVDKIFQPFFTTKPTGQGTGLGLSLAYDIVTKGHGGELKVETKEGEGSLFSIRLPYNLI